jgi:hypothetical protein
VEIFLYKRLTFQKNQTPKGMDVLKNFIGFYITPLEWSLLGSYVANISSGNLPYNAKEK